MNDARTKHARVRLKEDTIRLQVPPERLEQDSTSPLDQARVQSTATGSATRAALKSEELVSLTEGDLTEPGRTPTALIQDCIVLEEVGRGGMGVVYKARHPGIDKTMAVKVLHKELAESAVNVKRFHQEAKAASLLNHPNLVSVYESGISSDGKPYLFMDFLDGAGLDCHIREQGFLDLDLFHHIFSQVCDGLSHAHECGVIHRDLKPANIMILEKPHDCAFVKIVDFGIARLLQQTAKDGVRVTQTGDVIGSPVYMSPEQCLGHAMDERSDIYSLGVVMYEALTGTVPFRGDNAIQVIVKQIQEPPLSVRKLRPDLNIPEALDNLILKALAKAPEDRWSSVAELKQQLDSIVACGDSPAETSIKTCGYFKGYFPHRPRWLKGKPFTVALLLAVFTLGAVCYSFHNSPKCEEEGTAAPYPAFAIKVPPAKSDSGADPSPLAHLKERERARKVQQHIAAAHTQLSCVNFAAAAEEFKKAYHLLSDGEENQYPAAEFCVAAGDAIVAARPCYDWQTPDAETVSALCSAADQHANWFYSIAQQFHQRDKLWPEQEIMILSKMETVGAPLSLWERHLQLLEENRYPVSQIFITSYDGGVRALSEADGRKKAEAIWRRALPYALKAKGDKICFPGPIEALADIYHRQGRYEEEVELRKVSLAQYDEAMNSPDAPTLYGLASRSYKHCLYSLQKLGRTTDYNKVKVRYQNLEQRARKSGWRDEYGVPPHLSVDVSPLPWTMEKDEAP